MSFGRASPAASVAWSQSAAPEAMQFVVPRGAGPGDIVSGPVLRRFLDGGMVVWRARPAGLRYCGGPDLVLRPMPRAVERSLCPRCTAVPVREFVRRAAWQTRSFRLGGGDYM